MKPRVCIFAAESLLHWSGYYVRAFRQSCDVLVLGPPIVAASHGYPDWDRVASYVVTNDIHTSSGDALERLALLPDGWDPDLLVVIQSGDVAIEQIGQVGCPSVYLSIDTWHTSSEYLGAYQYDFVFLAQRALIKYMRKSGCCRVFWLPLGCDLDFHYVQEDVARRHDVVFVGRTHYMVNRQRRARLAVLEKQFNLGCYSGLGAAEMAMAYGCAPLIFNASIARDVNMRVFEVLATGRPLITNRDADVNGLLELFEDGHHLITYDDTDLVAQVRRYLNEPDQARAIGEAGQVEVRARHTYSHRVEHIFETLRAHQIEVGRTPRHRRRSGNQVRDLMPFGAQRVIDIGLGLASSRLAMAHRGVDYLAGIAPEGDLVQQRANSYDALWTIRSAPEPTGDFDTAVCASRGQVDRPVDGLLDYARDWLVEGGRIVLIMGDDEIRAIMAENGGRAALDAWFEPKGCRLLAWYLPTERTPHHVVVVALVHAGLDEINVAMYGEFPVNGTNAEPWKGFTDDEVPGSPDAEGP